MPKYNVLPDDMKLYSPAEPKGRLFLKGEAWPGDAWSDKPGGEVAGKDTAAQALKDLIKAQEQNEAIQAQLENAIHSAAQADQRAEAAEAALEAQAQALKDAEAAKQAAEAVATEVTADRDRLQAW
jgi:hypothetical protein